MRIRTATLETCGEAEGAVVVIDVLRAFTTAAYAFDAGASEIIAVGTVDEAFALRDKMPDALIMGEVNGQPVVGFDLTNAPSALIGRDLSGRRLIHRSTAGTQGIVRSARASELVAASLCTLTATVRYLRRRLPDTVTLVHTGVRPGGWGVEDIACGDAIEKLLRGEHLDPDESVRRVLGSRAAASYDGAHEAVFPAADLECATRVDQFDFAMAVDRRGGLHILRTIPA